MEFLLKSAAIIFNFAISFFYLISIRSHILKRTIPNEISLEKKNGVQKISVIIPARNEELNIGKILSALLKQTVQPDEIIVVNDDSSDKTAKIVETYSRVDNRVKLVNLKEDPPEDWIGKSWALWNGVHNSNGDLLIFLDADVEPEKEAIGILLSKYNKSGGMISVWPYQRFERFYEHLGFTANLLTVYCSKNFRFRNLKPAGAFGPVIVTSRKDYFETGGHKVIKNTVLEDLKFGRMYLENGKNVSNFLGNGFLKFRMYPGGILQLFEGHTKNMSAGSITGGVLNFIVAFIWMAGFYSSIFWMFDSLSHFFVYTGMVLVIYILSKPLGDYSWYDYVFYPLHFLFFLLIFVVSTFKTLFMRKVSWRGRVIRV